MFKVSKKYIQRVKIRKLRGQKTEEQCFYQNGVCPSKKSKFVKKQESSGLLFSLGIKKPLSEFLWLIHGIKWMK